MNKPRALAKSNRIANYVSGLYSPTAHWIVITVGIVLRVAQFLYNRSLTEGEAALALNIIERSYMDLLKPLDYFQAAPVGFLIIQKYAANVLGATEYALRLFPLVAGIIALFFFYHVAKRILTKEAIPVALILFAVGDHLVYGERNRSPCGVARICGLGNAAFAAAHTRTGSSNPRPSLYIGWRCFHGAL